MAKNNQEGAENAPVEKHQLNIGMDELKTLITTAVAAATEQQGKAFIQAMADLRKPYTPPGQEENNRKMRENMRQLRERLEQNRLADYENCPHKQGSNALSEVQGLMGSFALHQLDTGEVIGICTNCQKLISSLRPEDRKFFAEKSANRMSRAGQRVFRDPLAAQRARFVVAEPEPNDDAAVLEAALSA